MNSESHLINFDEALAEAFKFTDQELAANRLGNASTTQNRRQNRILIISLAVVASSIVLTVWFVVSLLARISLIPSDSGPLVPLIMLVAAVLVFGWLMYWMVKGEILQKLEGSVSSFRGGFNIEEGGGRRQKLLHTLLIEEGRFPINADQTQILREIQGRELIVYFFDRSRQIASVEIAWEA